MMKIGQHLLSKSKIQDHPVEYIYNGPCKDRMFHLISADGIKENDVEVYVEWFNNRTITILEVK